jgi:anti-sigma B factor antagonist
MQITQTDFNKYKVVKLTGEVDLHNSREVKRMLLGHLDDDSHIVVDFSELGYIDSSGMATLVEAFNTAKSKNLEFHIVGAKDAPLQVLQLTRLDSVFSMAESLDQVGS